MRTFSIHLVRNTLIAFLFVAGLGVAYYYNSSAVRPTPAVAGTTQKVSGWAWSDSYGWISLNSIDCDKNNNGFQDAFCGGGAGDNTIPVSNYGVDVDTAGRTSGGTGDFSGNAWSENVGWISFDRDKTGNPPAAPFNGGAGTIAQIDWSTGVVSGWAKVVGATTWDGWIKLGGDGKTWNGSACVDPSNNLNTNRCNYGVTITGGKLSGYAWGGGNGSGADGAIGWINFAPTINGVPIGGQVSAPVCVAPSGGYNPLAPDPTMFWGSCQPTAVCGDSTHPASATPYTNEPGVIVAACTENGVPTGGTTVVSCGNNATLICPLAAPPTTTKTHWWQF